MMPFITLVFAFAAVVAVVYGALRVLIALFTPPGLWFTIVILGLAVVAFG